MNFQIDLAFKIDNTDKTTITLQGIFQGRSGEDEWRSLKEFSGNATVDAKEGKLTFLYQHNI